jgi:DNA-binding LacI/PurR family transcriptional regulator
MGKQTVTSADVARRAGVSRTTVSIILNHPQAGGFPEETRTRVREAVTALGYSPNSAARMLVRGDTETIGLVISAPELMTIDGFVPQLLSGISETANRSGYRVLLETVADLDNPTAYLDLVGGKRIDGLIVLNPQRRDKALIRLIDEGFPVVLLGSVGHPREYTVNSCNSKRVRELVAHLAALGHRRIAHIALSPPGYVTTNTRLATFRRAVRELGLDTDEGLIAYGRFSVDSGYRAMIELLDRDPAMTAVFAANDTLALGAMAALRERGRRIPEDMAIVGFDDLPFAAYTAPPLTTIRSPALLHGQVAATKLIRLLHGEAIAEQRTQIDTQVIIRRSCGSAAAS